MQPTTVPILSGTNLATTTTGTEPQGLAAPQAVDTTSERKAFGRVLNQEQGTSDPDAAPVAEPDQGGSDLPAAGNNRPMADAEPTDSADSGAVATVSEPGNPPDTHFTGLPDEGVLPVLTDIVPGARGSTATGAAAGLATAEQRSTVGPRAPAALSQPTGVLPATSQLPVLTNPANVPPAAGNEFRGRLATGTEGTVTAVEQRLVSARAARGPLADSSHPAIATLASDPAAKPVADTEETSVLMPRQLSTAASGRASSLLGRSLHLTANADSTRVELQVPVSAAGDLSLKPSAAVRADTLTNLRAASAGFAAGPRGAAGNGQRVGPDMLPTGATAEAAEIGLSSTDLVAARTATTQASPASSLIAASAMSAPQPVVQAPGATASAPAQFTIDVPVLDSAWQTAVNERVVWMAGRGVQSAELRLNPAELGPLQVKLAVDERGVNLTINAVHPATRDALEGALPRLREMLSEQGMNLADANVSDQGVDARQEHDADGPAFGTGGAAGAAAEEIIEDAGIVGPNRTIRDDAMIDVFA